MIQRVRPDLAIYIYIYMIPNPAVYPSILFRAAQRMTRRGERPLSLRAPLGRRTPLQRSRPNSLSPPISACGYWNSNRSNFAKAKLLGEGRGEGGLEPRMRAVGMRRGRVNHSASGSYTGRTIVTRRASRSTTGTKASSKGMSSVCRLPGARISRRSPAPKF